ncbi:sigma-54-dependent transcriptional regulator [Candidatus Uabimicrobium amorphum]|uniref:Sigma-54-dependent Fis family transcriptional regulator n=1 Tax=Uabimicrobium amorphum TaxID=2596890 RepID=A0A5S9IPY9_UABAM|nr:sigma-54 dependent transcriptional regulator [Candidatus Uabimicrobium amorphum]BBM85010.1 sigma-54-dependent Fis family transcriptional regulator [Candidatus Uabimicrobium amorphum]
MSKESILIIDDNELYIDALEAILRDDGYEEIFALTKGHNVLATLENNKIDLILLDISLPDVSGIELYSRIKENKLYSHIPIIFITGHGDVKIAVEAMKLGAFYFLSKPVQPYELQTLIRCALDNSKLQREIASLKVQLQTNQSLIIGKTPAIKKVMTRIAQVAHCDATVFVKGESGTGKSLVAKAIHESSLRSKHPFIAIDCGAIPSSLLESELFGHEKGAFTGAVRKKKGFFLRAHQGTLFLDEITNLPLELQPKLLRVIQEREITPIGSDKEIKVDVRIVTATNDNIEEMVNEGKFRRDLYYRLNVFSIDLPPLHQRREDIPLLAQHFLNKYSPNTKKSFSKEAMQTIINYDWPGNIRELDHAIEHAVIISNSKEIQKQDLPSALQSKTSSPSLNFDSLYTLKEMEKKYLEKVLMHTSYNQTQAAKILGIERKSLWRKLKRFEISIPQNENPNEAK